MTRGKALEILRWWARVECTLIIRGRSGHIYDVVLSPMTGEVCTRWLGSNVYEAAGSVLSIAYASQEPVNCHFKDLLVDNPEAKKRFQFA